MEDFFCPIGKDQFPVHCCESCDHCHDCFLLQQSKSVDVPVPREVL